MAHERGDYVSAEVLLGTQGWNYEAWISPFYPVGTKQSGMLAVYSRAFSTVEVDSTAYGLPADPSVAGWGASVPPQFKFAMKLPQEVTHERRLVDTQRIVRRFVDRVAPLEERLGPLLIQLSPGFRPSDENHNVLQKFLESLPGGYRWAIEFRHPGWMTPAVGERLKSHNVALALVDGRWIPRDMMTELAIEPTADFAYLRWLGVGRRLSDFSYPQLDRESAFDFWVEIVEKLRTRVSTIYGYFSNHFEGHAPHSVRELQGLLGQEPVAPEALREQAELF